jgi:type I restriction enzyme S subunit
MSLAHKAKQVVALRRFRPYPAYRDSGVEWLGKIPVAWEAKPLKHLTAFSTGWTPPTGREDLYAGDHPWANISDLGVRVLTTTEKSISDAAIREARLRIVRAGSLLFSFKLSVGTVSMAGSDMYTNEAIAAFAPSPHVDTQYLYWAAPVLVPHNAQENIYGAPLLSRERIANAILLDPTIAEQRAIAAFLDRETARIDTLVAKKERLVKLLQEDRTALITRAVTKGLDPNVPMKDSGIEWLGAIPAHWEVRRIAMAAVKITNGYVGPTRDILVNEGVRYLQSLHIKNGAVDFDRRPYFVTPDWSREHEKSVLAVGDVLVVQTGDIGQVAVVPREFAGCNCHALIIIRLIRGLGVGEWLATALQSDYGQASLRWSQTGALHPHLECGHVREIRVAFPPVSEQAVILQRLTAAAGRVEAMLHKVGDAIERLKELRIALISAAVTGKIDVREEIA